METYVPNAASIRYSLCASTQTISPAHIITLTGQHHLKGKTKKIRWEYLTIRMGFFSEAVFFLWGGYPYR